MKQPNMTIKIKLIDSRLCATDLFFTHSDEWMMDEKAVQRRNFPAKFVEMTD